MMAVGFGTHRSKPEGPRDVPGKDVRGCRKPMNGQDTQTFQVACPSIRVQVRPTETLGGTRWEPPERPEPASRPMTLGVDIPLSA